MKAKDWLAAALFLIASGAAIAAVVLVMAHERTRHRPPHPRSLGQTLNSCYQNLGNGGC